MPASLQQPGPRLPPLLARPIHALPVGLRNAALAALLNGLFRDDIDYGRLDFLRGHALGVRVDDAGLTFQLRLDGDKLRVTGGIDGVALTIRGSVYDFLLLIARREDADTLFFQRRLRIQGNTELGLEVKNFLDSVDVEALPFHRPVDAVLQRGIPLYEQLFTRRV